MGHGITNLSLLLHTTVDDDRFRGTPCVKTERSTKRGGHKMKSSEHFPTANNCLNAIRFFILQNEAGHVHRFQRLPEKFYYLLITLAQTYSCGQTHPTVG